MIEESESRRILHIITGLGGGGAERVLYNLLSKRRGKQVDSVVISLRDEGVYGKRIKALGVPVYALGMAGYRPSTIGCRRLVELIRNYRPHLLQGWMYHGNLAAWFGQKVAQGRPALVWNVRHSLYDLSKEKWLTQQVVRAGRWLSGAPDAVIYNSLVSRSQHETFGYKATKGQVIPNGFDLSLLKPDRPEGASVRSELGLSPNSLVVGHMARFHPMKNHSSFMRAAVRVAHLVPSSQFLMVGREVTPDNPALRGNVPRELLGKFVFTGERDDPHRLMQAMDVLVSSSAWGEGFPNVLGEAMACGVPCVTTDVGDSAAIVGETGEVVPSSDSDALARALVAILEMPAEVRRDLGQAARARMEAYYGLESMVSQYDKLYTTLVERNNSEQA